MSATSTLSAGRRGGPRAPRAGSNLPEAVGFRPAADLFQFAFVNVHRINLARRADARGQMKREVAVAAADVRHAHVRAEPERVHHFRRALPGVALRARVLGSKEAGKQEAKKQRKQRKQTPRLRSG